MMNRSYKEWLRNQEKLIFEAKEIAKKYELKTTTHITGRKPPILKIHLNGEFLEFRIKEVKQESRTFWICKVSVAKPTLHWLIHIREQGEWYYIMGDDLINKADRRNSTFKRGQQHYVIDAELCKSYNGFLRRLKKKEDKAKQKVMSQWLNGSQ